MCVAVEQKMMSNDGGPRQIRMEEDGGTAQTDQNDRAEGLGAVGGGGEYTPQKGFGWTNGVVLHFLQRYGGWL